MAINSNKIDERYCAFTFFLTPCLSRTGFLPKGSMMGPLEKGGMVLVVCGLVACAVFMFTLHDVKAFSMNKKPVVFTQGEK